MIKIDVITMIEHVGHVIRDELRMEISSDMINWRTTADRSECV